MALVKCRECGKEVSNSAKKCPHCGIDSPAMSPVKAAFILIMIVVGLVWFFSGDDEEEEKAPAKPPETAEQKAARLAECKKSLQCWVDENEFKAMTVCKSVVDDIAKYEYEWLDGFSFTNYEPFSEKMAWVDKEKGSFILYGRALKIQNGFGAWSRPTYSCEYDPTTTIGQFKILD